MKNLEQKKMKIQDITYIGLFVALIAICSWISIPMAVPFTLQTFAVFSAVAMLGGKRSTITILVYMLLGAVGVPVFSGFKGGLGSLFGLTGGYILGFLLSAIVTSFLLMKLGRKVWAMTLSMTLGLVVCYLFGTLWFMFLYARNNGPIGFIATLGMCVFPFIIPDLLKIALAILLDKRVGKYVK